MNRLGGLLFLLLALLGCGTGALAQDRMSVTLVPETGAVAPGSTVTLAFVMRPAIGWHGYWRNSGDAGAEPRVQWQLPQGWQAGALQYPVPDRLTVLGLMNYVYEHDHALLVPLRVPPDARAGSTVRLRARLDYLVCTDEICVPESDDVATELSIGRPGQSAPEFAAWRQALPRPLGRQARFELAGQQIRLAIPLPRAAGLSDPYFFPVTLDALGHSAPQSLSRNGDLLIVETAAGRHAATLAAIDGVLKIGDKVGLSLTATRGEVPAAGIPIAAPDG